MATWTLTRSTAARTGPNAIEVLLEAVECLEPDACQFRQQSVLLTSYQAEKLLEALKQALQAGQQAS